MASQVQSGVNRLVDAGKKTLNTAGALAVPLLGAVVLTSLFFALVQLLREDERSTEYIARLETYMAPIVFAYLAVTVEYMNLRQLAAGATALPPANEGVMAYLGRVGLLSVVFIAVMAGAKALSGQLAAFGVKAAPNSFVCGKPAQLCEAIKKEAYEEGKLAGVAANGAKNQA